MSRYSFVLRSCTVLLLAGALVACQKENPATSEKLDKIQAKLDKIEQTLDKGGLRGGPAGARPQGQPPAQPDPAATYSVPIGDSPVKGPATAKVTLVKVAEFACPFCRKGTATVEQLQKDYGNNLRVVWKHYVVHPQIATAPSLATCAAQKQGKFFEFEKAIWEGAWDLEPQPRLKSPDLLSQASMEKLAGDLRLDMARFKADMAGEACKAQLTADQKQMAAVGVRGTPAFYINGRHLSGAQPIERFKAIIDEEMKKADDAIKGGVKPEAYYDTLVAKGRKTAP